MAPFFLFRIVNWGGIVSYKQILYLLEPKTKQHGKEDG